MVPASISSIDFNFKKGFISCYKRKSSQREKKKHRNPHSHCAFSDLSYKHQEAWSQGQLYQMKKKKKILLMIVKK